MTHDSQKIEMNPNSIYCKIGNLAAITVKFTTKQNIEAYNGILDNIPHSQYWSLCYARESDTGTWKKMYVWGTNLFSHEMLNASLRVQSASFLILGKAAQCIKFGKMVLITIDGKVTQSLQSGVWSEDFVLPFEPAYNTTWIGRISDYDQGLINANISVSFKSIKIRPTMDINVDHLIRFQIMYPCK